MDASETMRIRADLMKQKLYLKFVKPTLLRLELERNNYHELASVIKGQIVLAYSSEEPSKLKNALQTIIDPKRMFLLSGRIDGQVWTPKNCLEIIRTIPSRQVMMNEVVGLLEGPMGQLASLLGSPFSSLVHAMQARASQMAEK